MTRLILTLLTLFTLTSGQSELFYESLAAGERAKGKGARIGVKNIRNGRERETNGRRSSSSTGDHPTLWQCWDGMEWDSERTSSGDDSAPIRARHWQLSAAPAASESEKFYEFWWGGGAACPETESWYSCACHCFRSLSAHALFPSHSVSLDVDSKLP